MISDFLIALPFVSVVYTRSRFFLIASLFIASCLSEIYSILPFGVVSSILVGTILVTRYAFTIFDSEPTLLLLTIFLFGFLLHGILIGLMYYIYQGAGFSDLLFRSLIFVVREFIVSVFTIFLFLSLVYSYFTLQHAFSQEKTL